MKPPAILLALLFAAAPVHADQADEYYRKGMLAIQQGRPEAAAAAFQRALQIRPDHARARFQLGQLPGQADSIKAKAREKELAGIRLPEINFRDVTLGEAITALNQIIETESAKTRGEDEALTPNFMIQDPSGALAERSVTLRLKNIPAKVALDYLLQQAGASARYDEHAIVIRPNR